MRFYKYPKIGYTLSDTSNNKEKWIVCEKIHGANFSIYYYDGAIKFAKRTGFLGDDDWFYDYHRDISKYEASMRKVHDNTGLSRFIIYGELYGGWYPENAATWKGAIGTRIDERGRSLISYDKRAIQEGIYYSRDKCYMVFDIAIIDDNGELTFLDYDSMIHAVANAFHYTPALYRGLYKDAIAYNPRFNSTIPGFLGMPKLPADTNIAEGIIVRPISGNRANIIKIKNREFGKIVEEFDMEEAMNSYKFILSKLVCHNRSNSLMSKIGDTYWNNTYTGYRGEYTAELDELIAQFIDDIWQDYNTLYYNVIVDDYEKANKYIRDQVLSYFQ
jgi:Rnl2 family RNA ligase